MAGFPLITALAAGGSALSAVGTIVGGVAEKRNADAEAVQLKRKGQEEFAASQRDAESARREATLANSRAQALAAASGGGAGSDAPTIVRLMSETAGQGELNAQSAMYGGLSRRAGLNDQARARRASGKASFLGSTLSAFGQGAKAAYSYGKSS
jgi:hypothetical protein